MCLFLGLPRASLHASCLRVALICASTAKSPWSSYGIFGGCWITAVKQLHLSSALFVGMPLHRGIGLEGAAWDIKSSPLCLQATATTETPHTQPQGTIPETPRAPHNLPQGKASLMRALLVPCHNSA